MFLFLLTLLDTKKHFITSYNSGRPKKDIISHASRNYTTFKNGTEYTCFALNYTKKPRIHTLDDIENELYNTLKGKCSFFYKSKSLRYKLCHFDYLSYKDFSINGSKERIATYQRESFLQSDEALVTEWEGDNQTLSLKYTCDPTMPKDGKLVSVYSNHNETKYYSNFASNLVCEYDPFMPEDLYEIRCYKKSLVTVSYDDI